MPDFSEVFVGMVIGAVVGLIGGAWLTEHFKWQPLHDQCVTEKTTACRELHASDTAAYLECVKPVKERCSP